MAITFGSLRHTTTGRKSLAKEEVKTYTPEFEDISSSTIPSNRRQTPYYPSAKAKSTYSPAPDNSYKIEVSKKFTVAPAYNKGAYQVINRNNIKDIGR